MDEALVEAAARTGHRSPLARVHPEDFAELLKMLGARIIFSAKDGESRINWHVSPSGSRLHVTSDDHEARGGAVIVTDDKAREFLIRVTF